MKTLEETKKEIELTQDAMIEFFGPHNVALILTAYVALCQLADFIFLDKEGPSVAITKSGERSRARKATKETEKTVQDIMAAKGSDKPVA